MPCKPDGSPPLRGRCPKDRAGLDHEEQGSLAEHHSGGGVHPHGSVDCSGNYELHETDVNEKGLETRCLPALCVCLCVL